jgi:hypothetical protein
MPQPAHNSVQQPAQSSAPCRRRISPAVALAVLSPVIAEVLSGATHLSVIFVIIPEILVWGGGALLIREVARRRKLSGTALLLMGFVLSLAEEIFIQQTSLAPLPWIKTAIYGRTAGVNWIYLLFQLGYESVWVVVVPVQLVELMYPERRSEHWLRTRGLIITSILFLLGAPGSSASPHDFSPVAVPSISLRVSYGPGRSSCPDRNCGEFARGAPGGRPMGSGL